MGSLIRVMLPDAAGILSLCPHMQPYRSKRELAITARGTVESPSQSSHSPNSVVLHQERHSQLCQSGSINFTLRVCRPGLHCLL